MPYRAIKTNIAESLNIIVQIERRPGCRFVSEALEIQSYQPEHDRYELRNLYRLSDELTERRGRSAETSHEFLAES